jgi:hypothetical protein
MFQILNEIKQSALHPKEINKNATFQNKIEKKIEIKNLNKTEIKTTQSPKEMQALTSSINNLNLTASNLNTVQNDVFITPENVNTIVLPPEPHLKVKRIPLQLQIPAQLPNEEKEIKNERTNVREQKSPKTTKPKSPGGPKSPKQIEQKELISTTLTKAPTKIYTVEELNAKGMKKEQLQDILVNLGAKKTGNKAELVERILKFQEAMK